MARRGLDFLHGSEEGNTLLPDSLETPAFTRTGMPNPTEPIERSTVSQRPVNQMNHYELSAFLETQGFGTGIIGAIVQQELDGQLIAMYVATPQYLDVAQSELQLTSILEAVKLKKIFAEYTDAKTDPQNDGPDRRSREDHPRPDIKLIPKLPDTSGKSTFSPAQWRAYGISVVGFVHLSDTKLAEHYERAFDGKMIDVKSLRLSDAQQRLDVYVANSMLHDPPRVIRDLLINKAKYTLNGVQSGIVISFYVTNQIFKKVDGMKDTIYERCLAIQPVANPWELSKSMQQLRKLFDQAQRQGMTPDNSLQMTLLRRLVKELIKLPELTDSLTIPYNDHKKEYPDDPAELIEFIESKGEELKHTNPKPQTAHADTSGGVNTVAPLTKGGICIHDRERNSCPQRAECKGKHVYTGKVCTNKWMNKVGLCSNWENCHDMHPYDASKFGGLSRYDAVGKYKDEMKANP